MKQDNYMSFSIVAGFFIGLIISIIKFNTPELIILCTIICTISLYLIVIFCVSFYMMFIDYNETKLNTDKLDSTLDYYLNEFDKREKEILSVRKYLKHSISSLNDNREE
ncbi:hypothetical protein CCY99_05945 [Helicobacter sp. 16-1353]|uniref:hypothetical protein n=1 Tax=Helicobacter sp. 16-1353 TaxID=2004996 RepID=UPI000DCE1B8E|nr:hypothetical protein [Helicobacter sp. 16-1353]RAX53132.1 hypothetical protein CCY99_05945 [Helicobacter sp. 16-1353]